MNPKEKVKIVDPLTGDTKVITLDRTGTNEHKLVLALVDPNLNRDQKDHLISMYLWERGKQDSSFLVDLFRYKGEHTKETRAFKSQMRFDFEIFISQFSKYVRAQAEMVAQGLNVDLFKERDDFKLWLSLENNKGKDYNFLDYSKSDSGAISRHKDLIRAELLMIQMAIYSLEEGEKWTQQIRNVANAREREKGKGIYVSKEGAIYTHDDPDMDEIIKKDRERESELNKEDGRP